MEFSRGLQLAVKGLVASTAASILLNRPLSGSWHLLYGAGDGDPATLVTDSVMLPAITAVA